MQCISEEDFLTKEKAKFAEYAHIIADSVRGPRGKSNLHNRETIDNIIILCPTCHTIIDNEPISFTVDVLRELKNNHENRIKYLTGLKDDNRVTPLFYHSRIGNKNVFFDKEQINQAILKSDFFPDYPIIDLSSDTSIPDNHKDYYNEKIRDLNSKIAIYELAIMNRKIMLFALAPQPLLICLGTKLQKISSVYVRQRSRNLQHWFWEDELKQKHFIINSSDIINVDNEICLVLSLSDRVSHSRIHAIVERADIWEITVDNPNMNIVKSSQALVNFSSTVMSFFSKIKDIYGMDKYINIFPAMPNSLALSLVEYGCLKPIVP